MVFNGLQLLFDFFFVIKQIQKEINNNNNSNNNNNKNESMVNKK